MRSKLKLITALAVGTGVAGCSGTPMVDLSATIHGVITDRGSKAPLKDVTLTTKPETETVKTGVDGSFMLVKDVHYHSTYQLTAALATYQTATATVTTADRMTEADIQLSLAVACIAGEKRCATDGTQTIETCDPRGISFSRMTCPMGQLCDFHGPHNVSCGAPVDLVVTKSGQGSGLIVSMPAGIDCGTTCRASFPQGATATITAGPFALSTFVGWSGDCHGTSPRCVINMDRMHTVGAQFDSTGYLLRFHNNGIRGGTVESFPAGIACGYMCNDQSAAFPKGTMVHLRATATPPVVITSWSGDCGGAGQTNGCDMVMDRNHEAGITFSVPQEALTVMHAGTGAGVISSMPNGIDCGATCMADFDMGTMVTLTAAPQGQSTFSGWSGDCTGMGDCMLTMNAAHNVTGSFAGVSFPIAVVKTGAGTVTSTPSGINCGATCTGQFGQGAIVTLTAAPSSGSSFTGWGGDCLASAATATCALTVDAAKNVTALFAAGNYQVTVTVSGSGTVTSTPAGINCPTGCTAMFPGGSTITLNESPSGQSSFGGWGGGCAASGMNASCMLMVTGNITVNAGFDPFYLRPFTPDASCVTLLHFDGATPLAQACGTGAAATETGTWAPVPSRTAALIDAAHSTSTGENAFVDSMRPGPQPTGATVEMTINKMGTAFNARTYAVLYSDEDALDPNTKGFRLIVRDDGTLIGETRDGAGGITVAQSAAGVIADNQWYFVAATLSGTAINILVEGTSVKTSTTPMHWTASSSTAFIGAERNGAGAGIYRFNGAFDEVRISSVVRY